MTRTYRDVAENIRRLMLDHAAGKLGLLGAPAAGPVGTWDGGESAPMNIASYFEITLEGQTFLVAVSEARFR
jgi:hypothetical protein